MTTLLKLLEMIIVCTVFIVGGVFVVAFSACYLMYEVIRIVPVTVYQLAFKKDLQEIDVDELDEIEGISRPHKSAVK